MLTGSLKDKIDIYEESESKNAFSEDVKSYSFSFSDRAEISYLGGAERQAMKIEYAHETIKFKVRFRLSTYTERHVILWRSEYYNIRGIDPDRHRKYLILTADRMPTGALNITT